MIDDRALIDVMSKASIGVGPPFSARRPDFYRELMAQAVRMARLNGYVILGPGSLSVMRSAADALTDRGEVRHAIELRKLVKEGERS